MYGPYVVQTQNYWVLFPLFAQVFEQQGYKYWKKMTLSWSKFVSKFSRRGRHISQRGSDNKGDLYLYQIRYIFCYKFSTRQKHKLQYRLNVSSHTQYQDYRRHTKRNTVQCAVVGYFMQGIFVESIYKTRNIESARNARKCL